MLGFDGFEAAALVQDGFLVLQGGEEFAHAASVGLEVGAVGIDAGFDCGTGHRSAHFWRCTGESAGRTAGPTLKRPRVGHPLGSGWLLVDGACLPTVLLSCLTDRKGLKEFRFGNPLSCDNPFFGCKQPCPPFSLQVLILRDFKSSNFVSVDCTGDERHFPVSVHFSGVALALVDSARKARTRNYEENQQIPRCLCLARALQIEMFARSDTAS